ncbi:MAG: NUDIX hydrolase [Acidobacteriota bacterium]
MKSKVMKHTASKEVYTCPIFRITEDEASDNKGYTIKRSIVRHKGSAVMMAVDEKNRVLLVRQYRLPAERYMWELPAGKIDDGETPGQTAKRELIEETGLRAKKWKKLAEYFPSPGYVQEKMTIYLATELTQGEAQPMEDERIETRWFTKRELTELVGSNKIIDSKTLVGYLYWAKM